MKTKTLILVLIFIGAVIESSFGLLQEIGLSKTSINIIRLIGLAIGIGLPMLQNNSQTHNDEDI